MKRVFLIVISVLLLLPLLSACGGAGKQQISFSSYMLNSMDRDDPNDLVLEQMILPSEAMFAYSTDRTETGMTQTVYVWHSLRSRQLWQDLSRLRKAIPDEDKMISITIGKEIKVNKKDIDFISRSDQSFAVVRALFPAEFRVNAKDFRYELQLACIRLSTDRTLGDYGVVVLQTATQGGLLLPDAPEGEIRFVMTLEEAPEITEPN